jgi:hypothetical protein
MAVNLESDGKRLSQETAEQRQKKITKYEKERVTQRRAEETLELRERRLKGGKESQAKRLSQETFE